MTIPAHLAVALGLTSCEVSEEELEGRLLLAGLTHNSDSFNSPLLELVTNAPQVFVDIVLPALGSLELRMLAGVNTKMRDVVVTNSGEAATTKKEILRVATLVRSVSILAWARENGCLWNARTFNAAAAGGHLEVLQWARANGCPWVEGTCGEAAKGGDLEVLQWAHSNGCPWNEWTCTNAANGGHLEVLLWARARERLPLERVDVHERGEWRAPRGAAVGARERMLMERGNVLGGGESRASRGASVGSRARLQVGCIHVRDGGTGRAPRGAAVGSRERMPVGQVHVRVREKARAPRPTKVGNRERLPLFRVIPSDST
jgi:hypothetical protein